jgi:hypothetical protein
VRTAGRYADKPALSNGTSKAAAVLSRAQETTLAAVVETFVPDDADLARTRELVAGAVDRLPRHKRGGLLVVLTLLASPAGGLVLAGRPLSFARLDRDGRERALRALARIGPLRPAFDALARLSLFAAYAVDDGSGGSAVWTRIGYPGPRSDATPQAPLATLPPPNGRISADAVVVGSGAGGGVAAALLAQAGLRVIVLEAGPPFEAVAARQREAEAFRDLYLEAGLAANRDLSVAILAGACVGGGTSINWSTSLRLRPGVARAWTETLARPAFAAELADAYDAVETRPAFCAPPARRSRCSIATACRSISKPRSATAPRSSTTGTGQLTSAKSSSPTTLRATSPRCVPHCAGPVRSMERSRPGKMQPSGSRRSRSTRPATHRSWSRPKRSVRGRSAPRCGGTREGEHPRRCWSRRVKRSTSRKNARS